MLFVKKYLKQSKGKWIDIIDYQKYEMSHDNLHFRFVTGGLYEKNIHPKYPPKSLFTTNGKLNENEYYLTVRALTWEAAHKDIELQKLKRVRHLKFEIKGVSYNKNKSKDFFRNDAPVEIKALAENLSDRTNPLWDKAINYINEPEFIYKIRKIRLFER